MFHRYLYILFLFCLCLFIPIDNVIAKFFIGFMVINWAVELRFIAKIKRIFLNRRRIHILLFALFYILYLIGLLYSDNMDYGRFDIEVKLSLVIFPILFATFEPEIFRIIRIRYLFAAFVAGCLFASVYCTVHALAGYLQTGDPGIWSYSRFSVLHHTSYFSMFLNFAVVLVLAWFREHLRVVTRWQLVGITLLLLYFSLMVVLITSKIGLISLLVIYLLFTLLLLTQKGERKMAPYPVILAVMMVTMMLMSPGTMHRMDTSTGVVKQADTVSANASESTAERILVWRSSLHIIREHPLYGVGTGNVKDALLKEYEQHGIKYALSRRLDAHNQYLQTTLSLGLIGLLALLTMLLWPGILAFIRKDYIYLFFILLVSMNIFVESMFENQAGVVFYAFFNTLLFWYLPAGQKYAGKATMRRFSGEL
ncbi:MAG: O-antigen ligase domain-containing protein [Bacteroidetes bacterium]|nr:MAG: O-antigen ligase domain-containing protein [Bacteroidota bacterium]